MAFGAGDPVASGTFKLKLSGGFKKQLKQNHVKLKPAKFGLKGGSQIDPTTGAGTLFLGKVTFKKGGKKYAIKNAKATLGASGGKGKLAGKAKGGVTVKLFQLSGGTVARNGFGADLTGVKAKFLKGAAKKINKALGLHSLHPGKAGKASASEQPKTVGVTGGTVRVTIPTTFVFSDPNAVAFKNGFHCISAGGGTTAIAPGTFELGAFAPPAPPAGTIARFTFPVTGGTVGPDGKAGAFSVAGGIRLLTGGVATNGCANETAGVTTSHSILEVTNLAPNLALGNIQSNINFAGTQPGCNFLGQPPTCPTAVFPGSKGVAIGQSLDMSAATVSADPTAKTVAINNALITNNALSATTLSSLFPDGSGTHPFAAGDKFGFTSANLTTR